VTGDAEELAALQRVMESDEDYFLRVTGHPLGPADAQSTLMFVPEGASPDDKAPFGVWLDDQTLGFWRRQGFTETGELRPWRYDKLESEAILTDKVIPWRGGGPGPTGGRGGGVR
jgi:hypothetical protein